MSPSKYILALISVQIRIMVFFKTIYYIYS